MSLVFNGTSNTATAALKTGIQLSGGSLTIVCTIYINALPASTADILSTTSGGVYKGYTARLLSTGQLVGRGNHGSTTTQTTSNFYLVAGQSYKIAFVKSGTTSFSVYIDKSNGVVTDTSPESSTIIDSILIGSAVGGSNYFNGSIVDLAVYNVALSAADLDIVLDPYKKPTDISTQPQDYWPAVSSDTASTSGTPAIVKSGATYDVATFLPPVTPTLLLGNTVDANYTSTTTTYSTSTGEYFLKFNATNSMTVYYLCMSVPSWTLGGKYFKMCLRNSSGTLLATGIVSAGAKGRRKVLITPTVITSGNDYYISFICNNTGYVQANTTNYVVRADATSTYSTPATTLNTTAATINVGTPQIWLEGIGDVPNTMVFPSYMHHIRNITVTSNTVTVSGLDAGVTVSFTITGGTYSKNGGAYSSSPNTLTNGDTLSVRTTLSNSYATTNTVTITAAGVNTFFIVRTENLNNVYINSWVHNSTSPIFDGAFVAGGH